MAINRPKPEEIVVKLRQVEVLMGQGMPRIDAIRQISVTEQTYYRRKKTYGGMGALPGHYRYNHRMFGHFMQDNLSAQERSIFMAGDGVSWIPAWVEGAVQTSLNAVAGIVRHLSGTFPRENPSPVDAYPELGLKNHRLNKFGRHRVHYKRKKFDTGCPFSSKPRQNGIQEVDPNALYNLFQDPGAAELRETLQGYIFNPLDHAIRNQTPLGTA